jgi:hypothetical protein
MVPGLVRAVFGTAGPSRSTLNSSRTATGSFLLVFLAVQVFALSACTPDGLAAARSSTTARLPGFAGCGGSEIRPTSILLGCGDGGQSLFQLRWSRWTVDDARATGEWWQNLCIPDCAAGHGVTAHVSVRLFRARVCSDRKLQFTRLTFRLVGEKPAADAKVALSR